MLVDISFHVKRFRVERTFIITVPRCLCNCSGKHVEKDNRESERFLPFFAHYVGPSLCSEFLCAEICGDMKRHFT